MFLKYLSRNTITLMVITVISVVGLQFVNLSLEKTISNAEDNALQETIRGLGAVFPTSNYNNRLADDCYLPKANSWAEQKEPQLNQLLLAKKGGKITGYILISSTYKGYEGLIKTLLVTDDQGTIKAVRIVQQNETPGLGNKIITTPWVHSFDDLKLTQASLPYLAVKKDGGEIDQFTGATITPRAIVNQIRYNMENIVRKLVTNPQDALATAFQSCKPITSKE